MNRRTLLLPVCAALLAAAFWKFSPAPAGTPDATPAATWRIGDGATIKQGVNYDDLAAESPIRLAFACSEPRHVYVFSHSNTDGTILLFPSPDVKGDLTNPLPAGNSVLPGRFETKDLAWTTRTGVLPVTTFVVVAARAPIAELDALLPHLRRWTNSVLTDRSMGVTNPKGGDVQGKPPQPLPSPLLQRASALADTATLVNGPLQPDQEFAGVWIGSWRVREKPAATPPPKSDK